MRSDFLAHIAQTSPEPDGFEISRGAGIYLYDTHGNAYIDGISGIAVSSLGHSHPRIIAAIKEQLDLHLHTHVYGEHIVSPQVKLARRLSEVLPENLTTTYFTNSGAEAVEGALKLARKFTNRYEIIACRHSYHGSTAGAESLRSDHAHTTAVRPLVPGTRHIVYNSPDDLQRINNRTAAVIMEPIQGEAGVILAAEGYLAAVKSRCRETGTLLILDEIQTGMGRSGKLWAFQHSNVVPDILLLAKALGGGLPLGAFISSHEIMHVLTHDPILGHLTTFGGNALCCAASLAALEITMDEDLAEKGIAKGKKIQAVLSTHALVKEVRGAGLMLAIDLHRKEYLPKVIKACRKEGLLVDWFLFNENSIRLYPPLIISDEEVDLLIGKIQNALNSIGG